MLRRVRRRQSPTRGCSSAYRRCRRRSRAFAHSRPKPPPFSLARLRLLPATTLLDLARLQAEFHGLLRSGSSYGSVLVASPREYSSRRLGATMANAAYTGLRRQVPLRGRGWDVMVVSFPLRCFPPLFCVLSSGVVSVLPLLRILNISIRLPLTKCQAQIINSISLRQEENNEASSGVLSWRLCTSLPHYELRVRALMVVP